MLPFLLLVYREQLKARTRFTCLGLPIHIGCTRGLRPPLVQNVEVLTIFDFNHFPSYIVKSRPRKANPMIDRPPPGQSQ